MFRARMTGSCLLAVCVLFSAAAWAGKWNAADYPLRVLVIQWNNSSSYRGGALEEVNGRGRANLFENGDPKGFQFEYDCGARVLGSPGYETYLARWKKPGREIEVLVPVIGGKPNEVNTCTMKVTVNPETAYYRRGNGIVQEEPAAQYKSWMMKHKYDPEHGLNQPVNLQAENAPNGSAAGTPAPEGASH